MGTTTEAFALSDIVVSPRGRITADLTEHGVVIAKVLRGAKLGGYIPPFTARFLSDASRTRFDMFCDSLFMSDMFEILYTNATGACS